MVEDQSSLFGSIIFSISSGMFSITEWNGSIVNLNNTIRSILSQNNYIANLFIRGNFNTFSIFKANLSWLVIINNCNSCFSIFTIKFLKIVWIVKLDVEILIRLPVFIIKDNNIKGLFLLALFEFKNIIITFIILSSKSISIDGLYSNFTSSSFFVQNNNSEFL